MTTDPTYSGYNLFIAEHYHEPRFAGEPTGARYKVLGPEWRALSSEEQDAYNQRAKPIQARRSRISKRSRRSVTTRATSMEDDIRMLAYMKQTCDNYKPKLEALRSKFSSARRRAPTDRLKRELDALRNALQELQDLTNY